MPERMTVTVLARLRELGHGRRPVTRAEATAAWLAVSGLARDLSGRPRQRVPHHRPPVPPAVSPPSAPPRTVAPPTPDRVPAAGALPPAPAPGPATADPCAMDERPARIPGPEGGTTVAATTGAGSPSDIADLAPVVRLRPRDAGAPRTRYSDADLLGAIRRAADDVGDVPSGTSYQEAARRLGLPSLPTVANRFGTWTAAVRAAGMTPRAVTGTHVRRWSPDGCWRALVDLTADLGGPPTMDQYELLAAGNDDLPSPATVRNRLGVWSDVTTRLLSADAHPVLGRLGIAGDVTPDARDEQILLAHLADEISDAELTRLVRDGLFEWRDEFGEPPKGLHRSE